MALLKKRIRKKKQQLDKLDVDILAELQNDSTKTVNQLKQILKKPAATIHTRIAKLTASKVIAKQAAVLDFKKLGLNTCAIIFLKLAYRKNTKEVIDRLKKINPISSISLVSGEYPIMIKAYFKDNTELERFLYDHRNGLKTWDSLQDLNVILLFSDETKPIRLQTVERIPSQEEPPQIDEQ